MIELQIKVWAWPWSLWAGFVRHENALMVGTTVGFLHLCLILRSSNERDHDSGERLSDGAWHPLGRGPAS